MEDVNYSMNPSSSQDHQNQSPVPLNTSVEELQGIEEQVGEEVVSADKPKKSRKQTKVPVGLD